MARKQRKDGPRQESRRLPSRSVILLTTSGPQEVQPSELRSETVGQKALGLLMLPTSWTLPFFVVASDVASADSDQLSRRVMMDRAARAAGLHANRVIVRSNAVTETIAERGALDSEIAEWCNVSDVLQSLRAKTQAKSAGPVHWIIQDVAVAHSQGQLSNERRVSRENRDWVLEVSGESHQQAAVSIGVREWRSGRDVAVTSLRCSSFLQISVALRQVAHWASQDRRRFLFEWVWDGSNVWIVQLDLADNLQGIKPESLMPTSVTLAEPDQLKVFRRASDADFGRLRKLSNAKAYSSLGYVMPPFFVLDSGSGLADFLDSAELSEHIRSDLKELTKRPLVLRTDGSTLPKDKREMLPRSEELRSMEEASAWLRDSFRPKCVELGIDGASLSLIAHHFIPSIASAWARAEPGKRWVRIEALWGIPEGLYWHSHDTFEVDVESADLSGAMAHGTRYPSQSHLRYKGTFIGPDKDGAWIHQNTDDSADWKSSIARSAWLNEIAHTTSRIAEKEKKAVEVMWFVDTHKGATKHKVLPWYHSEPLSLDVPDGTPRRKLRSSYDVTIHTEQDWLNLKLRVKEGQKIERVIVEPRDSRLERNLPFAEELGAFSAENSIVIVLSGGILSHAFHVLRRKGAHVECVDLYGTSEDRAEYNKVVRDKVPQHIASRGERYESVRLVGDALLTALRRKLVEEAFEALDASSGTDLLAELADVQEVVFAITKAVGSTVEDLERERTRKLKKRGGFESGLMLETTSSPRSLTLKKSLGPLLPEVIEDPIKTISNPAEIPVKARYRRPDHRVSGTAAEELLSVELELNRLTREKEEVTYSRAEGVESSEFIVETELRRHVADLRLMVKVRNKPANDVPEQGTLTFGDPNAETKPFES